MKCWNKVRFLLAFFQLLYIFWMIHDPLTGDSSRRIVELKVWRRYFLASNFRPANSQMGNRGFTTKSKRYGQVWKACLITTVAGQGHRGSHFVQFYSPKSIYFIPKMIFFSNVFIIELIIWLTTFCMFYYRFDNAVDHRLSASPEFVRKQMTLDLKY